MNKTYRIVRFYRDDRQRETIEEGVSLDHAQAHCNDRATAGADFFDGYEAEE